MMEYIDKMGFNEELVKKLVGEESSIDDLRRILRKRFKEIFIVQ